MAGRGRRLGSCGSVRRGQARARTSAASKRVAAASISCSCCLRSTYRWCTDAGGMVAAAAAAPPLALVLGEEVLGETATWRERREEVRAMALEATHSVRSALRYAARAASSSADLASNRTSRLASFLRSRMSW